MHGNLLGALDVSRLMVMTLPFLGFAFAGWLAASFTGAKIPGVSVPVRWIWTIVAVVLAFALFRVLPVHPFNVLAS